MAVDDHRVPDPESRAPGGQRQEPEDSGDWTPQQLRESKQYGRAKLRCTLIDLAVDLVYLVFLALILARPLDQWLAQFGPLSNRWLRLAAFFLATTLLHSALSLPLSFYAGYVLEHRYGLSRQTAPRWISRYVLQNGLSLALGLVLLAGLFLIIWTTGFWWWVIAAAGVFLVSIVLGQLAPVLILPLFYKVERLEDDEQKLFDRFQRLTEGTGLDIEGVYRMQLSRETVKANAMLAGMGRTRRVILGDTLLDNFTPDEIEVVFAHEVGHHVHRHLPKMLLGGMVMSLASFYVCDLALRRFVTSFEGSFDYAQVPVYALALILLVVSVVSMLMGPLRNVVSRHFERQCDRYALERTSLHQAYRSAFTKLARLNKADPDPHRLEVLLMHDHPPISERIAMSETEAREAGS